MSVSTIERIGDNLATGLVAIIVADGASFPLPVFGPRSTDDMSVNRVEVRAGGFFRASDQMNFNPSGVPFYNHRRGILSATVVTQRQKARSLGVDSNHGEAIGRLRWLMTKLAQKLTPATIVGYEVMDVIDMGDLFTADMESETDRTELRFQIDLCVPATNYTDS